MTAAKKNQKITLHIRVFIFNTFYIFYLFIFTTGADQNPECQNPVLQNSEHRNFEKAKHRKLKSQKAIIPNGSQSGKLKFRKDRNPKSQDSEKPEFWNAKIPIGKIPKSQNPNNPKSRKAKILKAVIGIAFVRKWPELTNKRKVVFQDHPYLWRPARAHDILLGYSFLPSAW